MTQFDAERTALLVIDMQPDFMPGGALPVQGAAGHNERLVGPVRDLMDAGLFPVQVATQDWHPAGHVSFASTHPGRDIFERIEVNGDDQTLWPDHLPNIDIRVGDQRRRTVQRVERPKSLKIEKDPDGAVMGLRIDDTDGVTTLVHFRTVMPTQRLDGLAASEH